MLHVLLGFLQAMASSLLMVFKRATTEKDFIYGVGHLVWPLEVYGNEPNMEQQDELPYASSTRSSIARLIDDVGNRLRTKVRWRSSWEGHEDRIRRREVLILGDRAGDGLEVGNSDPTIIC